MVVDFRTNQNRVCDFLLVHHGNLDPIADVGASPSQNLKLISREIIFEISLHMCSQYLNVTDRRTDR